MNKKRVLVLNPPNPDRNYLNRDLMGGLGVKYEFGNDFLSSFVSKVKNSLIRLPVMQLVYGASLLHEKGFDLMVIDAACEQKKLNEIIPDIKKFSPDYILLAVSSSGFMFERDVVASEMKRIVPNTKIIAVGDMIAQVPNELLPYFDIGIVGDVEESIVNICEGKKLDSINGIIYQENGSLVTASQKALVEKEELEELPFPKWDLFPYKNYRYYPMLHVSPIVSILSSRGCPYGCGYCPYPVSQGKKWRARSAQNIYKEIENGVKKYNVRGFYFRDPLFTLNFKRIEEMCDLIIKNNIKIEFVFETRPELLTHELIDKLHEAGCRSISFGVEDIHPDILKLINRQPVNLEKIKDSVNYCENKGIRTSTFIIVGLPGSTIETIEESIKFSRELLSSQIDYKVATPFPGTQLYNMAKKNRWIKSESYDLLGSYNAQMQISKELTPEYLQARTNRAFKEYYYAPNYIIKNMINGNMFFNALIFMKIIIKG